MSDVTFQQKFMISLWAGVLFFIMVSPLGRYPVDLMLGYFNQSTDGWVGSAIWSVIYMLAALGMMYIPLPGTGSSDDQKMMKD